MDSPNLRRYVVLASLLAALFSLTACTQIPAELEEALLGSSAPPATTATTTPAPIETSTPEVSPTTDAPAALPSATATEAETLADSATAAPEEPTADAPAFVLPTPTSHTITIRPGDAPTTTAPLTTAVALTVSETTTATVSAPLFAFPTATPRLTPTVTTVDAPMARVLNSINIRSGPGTNYPVIAGLAAGAQVEIVGRNAAADWWQVLYREGATGWLSAPLVEVEESAEAIALVSDIPTPPPSPTPAPAMPSLPADVAPAINAPADTAPAAPATATPVLAAAPTTGQAEFRVVGKRLWDVYENGGSLDGPSVTCGAKRQLVVNVVDAGGAPLNGVAVQAQYGAREIFVTGSQGKGDGQVEFVLGGGQDVKVLRDNDGSDAISEMATGLATHPDGIDVDQLMQARYCSDAESCQRFIDAPGCYGHFSWTVTFQRNR